MRNSYKKCDVLYRLKFQKPSNYQQQQPQLPFTMHKLSQDPSKRVQRIPGQGNDPTQGCNVVSESFKTITSNNAKDANKAFR